DDICSVVAGVAFHSRTRRNVILRARSDGRLVELIDFGIVLSHKSPMNCPRIRLTLLEPEECSLAITKPPEIGIAILPLIWQKEPNIERGQGRFVECQRALHVAYSQDDMVDHFLSVALPEVAFT